MADKIVKDDIEIVGARENNLKNISLNIPKDKLVLFTGVSGSGKSSLVYDTIATEAHRVWEESYPLYLRNMFPHLERPNVDLIKNLTPTIMVDQKQISAVGTIGSYVDIEPLLRLLFSRLGKPNAGSSQAYNAHNPLGMCPVCGGYGNLLVANEDNFFDLNKSINEKGIKFSQFNKGWMSKMWKNISLLDSDKKLKDFSKEEWRILKYGPAKLMTVVMDVDKKGHEIVMDYEGVITKFSHMYIKRDLSRVSKWLRDEVIVLIKTIPCEECKGTGLNAKALASKINSKNIWEVNQMEVSDLPAYFKSVKGKAGESLVEQIMTTVNRMINVGLGYLNLNRDITTVSGGEGQRLKMVKQIGASLNNVTYIFDEPTAGLHPDDATRIAELLIELRDKVNSVLVVEHSRLMIETADQVIELGPWSGGKGGKIDFQGTVSELKKTDTVTAKALTDKIVLNKNPRKWTDSYPVKNATLNNLKDVSVDFPKGVWTAVTGVAGSGKSTLIKEFIKLHPEAILISQKALGTSDRSTPATYTGISDIIRKLFAKENIVSKAYFSFNSKKGMCPVCKGKGYIMPEQSFADSVAMVCDACGGKRYNNTTLGFKYKGKNIWEVMNMTIEQAAKFFDDPNITSKIQSLIDVGLGYITLGQQTSTLSGGENQRLKLAANLYKKGNIYVLDEPTTGLSNWDIKKLMNIFNRIVEEGNTVITIEHRLEMISQADWIIDMGPHGGKDGGKVLFTGTPENLIKSKDSLTAQYMKKLI